MIKTENIPSWLQDLQDKSASVYETMISSPSNKTRFYIIHTVYFTTMSIFTALKWWNALDPCWTLSGWRDVHPGASDAISCDLLVFGWACFFLAVLPGNTLWMWSDVARNCRLIISLKCHYVASLLLLLFIHKQNWRRNRLKGLEETQKILHHIYWLITF